MSLSRLLDVIERLDRQTVRRSVAPQHPFDEAQGETSLLAVLVHAGIMHPAEGYALGPGVLGRAPPPGSRDIARGIGDTGQVVAGSSSAEEPSDDEGLRVVFDATTLHRSVSGSITAGIWFEADDKQFPEKGWNDFAVVILGWWLSELRGLPARKNRQAAARLEFMDGPVEVEIRAPEAMAGPWLATWVRRGGRRQAIRELSFSAPAFLTSVRDAAGRLLSACEAQGWSSADLDSLGAAVRSSTLPP